MEEIVAEKELGLKGTAVKKVVQESYMTNPFEVQKEEEPKADEYIESPNQVRFSIMSSIGN